MNNKMIAQETLKIQRQGYYFCNGIRVDIAAQQAEAERESRLITPDEGEKRVQTNKPPRQAKPGRCQVINASTVQVIVQMYRAGQFPAALNFASAKNPGGGFLNGAMAQEEALAMASGLYNTLLPHENTYYETNRNCGSMMYTDHAIYSPKVVFFRDEKFQLLPAPAAADILTLPAVNMGQVLLKGENAAQAKAVMRNRMRLCLAILAAQQARHIILGAYGCGVFRNNPLDVANWWRELLQDEGYIRCFDAIVFAVLDRSAEAKNLRTFEKILL